MQVVFHKNFKKQTKKLKALKTKIEQRLFLFMEDPFNPILNNHPLIGKYKGYRSINITADYRAVYESINDDLAFFITLDKHSNLYK
ncbi:MAG: translation repressor RelE [Candidatus Doudnabacteria bacterium Gr01-1014_77]|uniref:Translation repressor RelE n=1 Tax=Candidatus Doudnabacteria bacterium Gr01-1014_77 TaxID=2017133 RepID=A0A554JE47_9BACT|nr:MAG: translation repressor RelE [Candidatus Doudnabacteria bacterium Gr01-1014_77]